MGDTIKQADSLDWIKGSGEKAADDAMKVSGDVVLEGSLGIAEAETMHQTLSRVLDAHVDVSIESEDLSRVDAAGAQLIYAFVKEAQSRSIAITWKSVSDALRETATRLGFVDAMDFASADG